MLSIDSVTRGSDGGSRADEALSDRWRRPAGSSSATPLDSGLRAVTAAALPAVQPDADSFGTRLRLRRLGRGLSQQQLAGPDFHASYVSLLESGRRHPTVRVTEVFAARLCCTVEHLLHGIDRDGQLRAEVMAQQAELALRRGEPGLALARLDAIVDASASTVAASAGSDLALRRARALYAHGQLPAAATAFADLASVARRAGHTREQVRHTVAQMRCLADAGDDLLPLALGHEALADLRRLGLVGGSLHAELAGLLAELHLRHAEPTTAASVIDEALAATRPPSEPSRGGPPATDPTRDPSVPVGPLGDQAAARRRSSMLATASLAHERRGALSDALALIEEAVRVLDEPTPDEAGLLLAARGRLLLRVAPPDLPAATSDLRLARRLLRHRVEPTELARLDLELARCALLSGNPQRAIRLAARVAGGLEGQRPQVCDAHIVTGQAHASLGQTEAAAAAFLAAADQLRATTWKDTRPARRRAARWWAIADGLQSLGRLDEAVTAYRHALGATGVPAPRPDVGQER
jgi:tetratricopeptide (TPR) repeat protein